MRRKAVFMCSVTVFILFLFSGTAFASEYEYFKLAELAIGNNEVILGNKTDAIEVAPYTKNGRTLVPLRFMEKALGAKVSWDEITETATLAFNGKSLSVTIGSFDAMVDGVPVKLDVPPELKKGRTFVPLRFISENLGARITYDPNEQRIVILYVDFDGWTEIEDQTTKLVLKIPTNFEVYQSDISLQLKTPNGTIFTIKSDSRDINTALDETRNKFSKNGWQIFMDKENSLTDFPYKGTTIASINQSPLMFYDGFFFTIDNVTCSWEITGQDSLYDFYYDDRLGGEIFFHSKLKQ